jgi:hypothetical protein
MRYVCPTCYGKGEYTETAEGCDSQYPCKCWMQVPCPECKARGLPSYIDVAVHGEPPRASTATVNAIPEKRLNP